MAEVHNEIHFTGDGTVYYAYLSSDDDIIITDNVLDASNNTIIIDRNEWNEFKNFIDTQFHELEK